MRTVTAKEFIDWIMSQPDEKQVHLRHSNSRKHHCLCPMAEFTFQSFEGIQNVDCGYYAAHGRMEKGSREVIWRFENNLQVNEILRINPRFFEEVGRWDDKEDDTAFSAYGELKQHIISHGIYTQE